MLLVVAGFPQAFAPSASCSPQLLVESCFARRPGPLGFQSAIQRLPPCDVRHLYIFTLLGLLMQIVGDTLYTIVDPRIDFEARG